MANIDLQIVSNYHKFPKYSDTKKFVVITLKVEQNGVSLRVIHPKDAEGIANSVDPDQSDLGLHCLPRPVCPKTLKHYGILRSKTVIMIDLEICQSCLDQL